MQIIGSVLILLIIGLFLAWLYWTKKQTGASAKETGGTQEFEIKVKGVYSPSVIKAKAGRPVRINFLRQEDTECSRFVVFDALNIRKELPRDQIVPVEFTPKAGEYKFTCDMGMYQGKLVVQ
ncbi:MAG: cupredoxin domain-containing protein [Candidatus Magasanikbacteria bacterium]|nr:cupredoxin domain-containing protein [Candidatus Magasanikbacteria bacterium]